MIAFDGKLINPAQVVWIGEVREVKRSAPKVKDSDKKVELPPVYNFIVKIGFEALKSVDFETFGEAGNAHRYLHERVNEWYGKENE